MIFKRAKEKNRVLLFSFLISLLVYGKTYAMTTDNCVDKLKFYDSEYVSDLSKEKLVERLAYLEELSAPCSDLESVEIEKANVLFKMHKFDEALKIIELKLTSKKENLGNLLSHKAVFLFTMKSSGFEVSQSYDDIIEILKKAKQHGTDNEHFLHQTWAEILIEQGKYEEASEQVVLGNDIKTIYRFYTLLAIIAEKIGKYEESVSFITDAIKAGGNRYLYEPDTVLSLTKALCHLGHTDKAKNVVENSMNLNDSLLNNLLIKESAQIVLNGCKVRQ